MNRATFWTALLAVFALTCACDDDDSAGPAASGAASVTPAEVELERITADRESVYLTPGESLTVHVTYSPDNANLARLNHGVRNPAVASMESGGTIRGISVGCTEALFWLDSVVLNIKVVVRALPKNTLRVHFQTRERNAQSYARWGVYLGGLPLPGSNPEGSGYILNDTLYGPSRFLRLQKSDSYGMYADVPIREFDPESGYDNNIIRAGVFLNGYTVTDGDFGGLSSIDPLLCNEIWFYEGCRKAFLSEPVPGIAGLRIAGDDVTLAVGDSVTPALVVEPSSVAVPHTVWQCSDQYVATVKNGVFVGRSAGGALIMAAAGGLSAQKRLCVVPRVSPTSLRVHYRRYNADYSNWFVAVGATVYRFRDTDGFGAYVDVPAPAEPLVVRTEFETAAAFPASATAGRSEVWVLQGRDSVLVARPAMDIGAFKIANSWSDKNGGWENVVDGFFHISYDAMKKMSADYFYVEAAAGYAPRLIAVFQVESVLRGDFTIRIGVGDTASPRLVKTFLDYPLAGYGWQYENEFPSNPMVLDISEFLPIDSETVFLEVTDGPMNRTLKVQAFSIEAYDDYAQPAVRTWNAAGLPAFTTDGAKNYFTIDSVRFGGAAAMAKRSAGPLSLTSRPPMRSDFDGYVESPARMPRACLERLCAENRIRVLDNVTLAGGVLGKTAAGGAAPVDNSKLPCFPPIGSQEYKGSCASWAVGYYLATYNLAKANGWDLSGARWLNGEIAEAYRDKIMSPDFCYLLVNNGVDWGSWLCPNIMVLVDIGIASMKTMPVVYSATSQWPAEEAWREAPLHRQNGATIYWGRCMTDRDVEKIKTLVAGGGLVSIAIAAGWMALTGNDTYVESAAGIWLDHGVTVVGFDDAWTVESSE